MQQSAVEDPTAWIQSCPCDPRTDTVRVCRMPEAAPFDSQVHNPWFMLSQMKLFCSAKLTHATFQLHILWWVKSFKIYYLLGCSSSCCVSRRIECSSLNTGKCSRALWLNSCGWTDRIWKMKLHAGYLWLHYRCFDWMSHNKCIYIYCNIIVHVSCIYTMLYIHT